MMKLQMLGSVALVAITAVMCWNVTPTYSQSDSTQVQFFCRQVKDITGTKPIPTTVAWIRYSFRKIDGDFSRN